MKNPNHPYSVRSAILATLAIAAATTTTALPANANSNGNGGGNSQMMPSSPTGWLTAFPTIVQTGTKPTLTWSITYPSTAANYVNITPPTEGGGGGSTVTSLEQLDVDIRVIGSGVTTGSSDGANSNWVPAQALLSVDGSSYKSIFYGTNPQVSPNSLVFSKRVNKGTIFRFGGRYDNDGIWSKTYSSDSGSQNIRILRNGEFPPTANVLATSPTIKSFMKPYLDSAGKVKIGPLDVIVMMELTQSSANAGSPFYNLQDMVLLMTCKPKGNNGHGNNIDGVDSSNPGNGHGGPNGRVDPSGTVDDEKF